MTMTDVIGYEGMYAVTEKGKVWSYPKYRHHGKFLKQYSKNNGYLYVGLSKNKKRKTFLVHRLIGVAFVENRENKPEINHKDGDKSNNYFFNLEWVTSSENQTHAIQNGLQRFTEKHRLAAIKTGRLNGLKGKGKPKKKLRKISDIDGAKLSHRVENGESIRSLGREFGVDKGTIINTIKRIESGF